MAYQEEHPDGQSSKRKANPIGRKANTYPKIVRFISERVDQADGNGG